jgi:hypothetical protein
MTKSRMTALFLALVPASGTTAAEPLADEYDIAALRPLADLDCPDGSGTDEIVVCGRKPGDSDRYRLPLPIEPTPGQRTRGEPLTAVEVAGKRETCSTVGPNQNCGGGLDIIGIAAMVAVGVAKVVAEEIIEPDE